MRHLRARPWRMRLPLLAVILTLGMPALATRFVDGHCKLADYAGQTLQTGRLRAEALKFLVETDPPGWPTPMTRITDTNVSREGKRCKVTFTLATAQIEEPKRVDEPEGAADPKYTGMAGVDISKETEKARKTIAKETEKAMGRIASHVETTHRYWLWYLAGSVAIFFGGFFLGKWAGAKLKPPPPPPPPPPVRVRPNLNAEAGATRFTRSPLSGPIVRISVRLAEGEIQ